MKVSELIVMLGKFEQKSEIKIAIFKDGSRPFGPMKEIKAVEPIFDQDTGEMSYSIHVSVGKEEAEYLKRAYNL